MVANPMDVWTRLRTSAADADIYRRFIPAVFLTMLMFAVTGIAVTALIGLLDNAIYDNAALSLGLGAVAGAMLGGVLGVIALAASIPTRWRRAKDGAKRT